MLMKRSFRRNLKAVSPVIATIIIVAIAIVMSIAVAYWMLGLGGAFTRFEKLEFQSAYAVYNATSNKFEINLRIKNTGSADATIDSLVFLNGKPNTATEYAGTISFVDAGFGSLLSAPLKVGDEKSFRIDLTKGTVWKSGMSLELTIQTVAGRQYPKVIVLP